MKKLIRILILTLLVFSVLATFAGCGGAAGDPVSSQNSDPSGETETLSPSVEADLPLSALSGYVIVRPKSAGVQYKERVYQLKKTLDESHGLSLESVGDGDVPMEMEILVGKTNRPESVAFMASLRYRDYGYAIKGKKILIGAHTMEGLGAAIDSFCQALTENQSRGTGFSEGEFVTRGTYATDDMKIFGLPVKGLQLVHDKAGEAYATILAEALGEASGYPVDLLSSRGTVPDTGNLLVLNLDGIRGTALPANPAQGAQSVIPGQDSVLLCGGEFGYEQLCYQLLGEVLSSDGKDVTLPSGEREVGGAFRTASYNVYVGGRTESRIEALMESIRIMNPDTVGLQEASGAWMEDFASRLPEYASVGMGRSGKNSEGTYILYRKDKFILVDSATFWLSDTPDRESKYSESSYPRICTYALLRCKSDGKMFLHVNTHLEHTSAVARDKQIAVLLKQIKMLGNNYPTVITGDFNCTSGTAVYTSVLNAGFRDGAEASLHSVPEGTFRSSGKVIDFCFLSEEKITPLNYRVFSGKVNETYPSDHNAVFVDFILN